MLGDYASFKVELLTRIHKIATSLCIVFVVFHMLHNSQVWHYTLVILELNEKWEGNHLDHSIAHMRIDLLMPLHTKESQMQDGKKLLHKTSIMDHTTIKLI